jgi:hypothetical protein
MGTLVDANEARGFPDAHGRGRSRYTAVALLALGVWVAVVVEWRWGADDARPATLALALTNLACVLALTTCTDCRDLGYGAAADQMPGSAAAPSWRSRSSMAGT